MKYVLYNYRVHTFIHFMHTLCICMYVYKYTHVCMYVYVIHQMYREKSCQGE